MLALDSMKRDLAINNESQSTGRERKGSIYDILAAIAKKKAQQNK